MSTAAKVPQHVLDTRYLQALSERILPPAYRPSTSEEGQGAATRTVVKYDLEDAAAKRYCDCDPDERGEEESDEDSDDKDGWFCSYRSIEDEYKMHVVLERARLNIGADPSGFSETIYREILERCNVEHSKVLEAQAREQRYSDGELQTSPPPSSPCGFPPFSLQHLPPEILVEIALLAQASNPHAHIALSHVDARLRAFVNSTPLLWSRVDFLYPLRVVDCYLERSTDNLLRVTALPPLHVSSAYNSVLQDVKADENNKLKEFLGALCPHRHRILSLRLRSDNLTFDVSGGNEGQMPAYDFLWDGSMVELELLDLELDAWTWEGMKVLPSYRIKELHLHGPWTTAYLPLFSLSLKSLVITSDHAPFSQIFDGLHAAPRLVNLTLRDMSFTGIGEKKGSVLNLDHLESLSLIRIVGSAAEALFSCIVTPNLTSITLRLIDTIDDFTDINQLQLLSVPQPSVQHLDLIACDAAPSFFASVFRTFPCITHLRIASSNILAEEHLLPLLGRLKRDDYYEVACPNLKHLTIDNELNGITSYVRLIAWTRHDYGFPLESVTLRGIPADDNAFIAYSKIDEYIPKLEIAAFDQELDVYRDSDDSSVSETSSEGDWASGDEEIVTAYRKYSWSYDLPMPYLGPPSEE